MTPLLPAKEQRQQKIIPKNPSRGLLWNRKHYSKQWQNKETKRAKTDTFNKLPIYPNTQLRILSISLLSHLHQLINIMCPLLYPRRVTYSRANTALFIIISWVLYPPLRGGDRNSEDLIKFIWTGKAKGGLARNLETEYSAVWTICDIYIRHSLNGSCRSQSIYTSRTWGSWQAGVNK